MLGTDYDGSPFTQSGNLVAELAVRGIRVVIAEFRADVTKTLKNGSRGKLRIDYGDPKQPVKPIAWLWKFVDGAKTAGELYGRALVVIAAEQYACRLVVPSSQQFGPKRWPSHRDHAAKALQKLAGPQLPATLKQLEKAIAKAGAELHEAQAEAHARKASSVEEEVGAGEETGDLAKAAYELEEVGDPVIDEQRRTINRSTWSARSGPPPTRTRTLTPGCSTSATRDPRRRASCIPQRRFPVGQTRLPARSGEDDARVAMFLLEPSATLASRAPQSLGSASRVASARWARRLSSRPS